MFSEGSVVICNGNDKGQLSLTIGAEYTVLSAYTSNVKVKNDIGHESWYNCSRFTQKSATPAKQIKLEVGKTYLTAGGYVVHITALKLSCDEYYTTIQCSPGYNWNRQTIQEMLSSRDHNREGDFKNYGWAYRSDGTLTLGGEWSEKLRIIGEFSKLQPAPKGFRYAGGFPQVRPPKQNEWYMSAFGGGEIRADKDESKSIIRVIIEKGETEMPPYPTMPAGFKFASDPPEHRKPKRGEWFIGIANKPDLATCDFVNSSYYIISKVEAVPASVPKEEVYPKYYTPLNIKDWAFIKKTSQFAHVLTKYDGTEMVADVDWSKHHDALYVEIPEEVALAKIKKPTAQTPAPPKITNLCVEVSSMTPKAQNIAAKPAPKQPRLSYWVTEPIGNMFGAAKKSARYVVASSLLAAVGYTVFNPVQTFNFVSSCLPKINIKFGSEPLKFVPINDIPVVPAEWGNKNVGSP